MKRIVVLGAGYAGLKTVVDLQKKVSDAEIILVDKNSYHYEAIALHEVAAGAVRDSKITYPIEDVLTAKTKFIQAEVKQIDVEGKKVILNGHQPLAYDYVVVALGFVSETFGIDGASQNALQMTDIDEANAIYQHIETTLKQYRETKNPDALKIIVCGAGFTGVELAGALADERKHYAQLAGVDESQIQIISIEASKRLLPMFSQELAQYGVDVMQKRGIKLMTGCMISQITPDAVVYKPNADSDETKQISAKTIIWTTGVSGSPVIAKSGLNQRRGRVMVEKTLTLTDHPEVYIIGDVSAVMDDKSKRPYPTTAQIALKMGATTAQSIAAALAGNPLPAFSFKSAGTVASVGNTHGLGQVGSHEVKGYVASALKKIIANKSLADVGGVKEVMAKGRFDLYH